uniref:Uncharacterized protein n=2 Tax=Ditylenchus dipsaci TaxID=166011 RepID=A0A915DNT6_9BILA
MDGDVSGRSGGSSYSSRSRRGGNLSWSSKEAEGDSQPTHSNRAYSKIAKMTCFHKLGEDFTNLFDMLKSIAYVPIDDVSSAYDAVMTQCARNSDKTEKFGTPKKLKLVDQHIARQRWNIALAYNREEILEYLRKQSDFTVLDQL